jgi:regulator of nonsense transcripts 2
MLAESLESRRFERKAMFDVPLPIRKSARDVSAAETNPFEGEAANTMAFSLMTKRGNKQQVQSIAQPFINLLLTLPRLALLNCHLTLALQLL